MGRQQMKRMAVRTALIGCPGKFVSLVEWLGRVRGEEVTNGGFDCALFGFLFVEPFKYILVGVSVQI